MRKIWLLAALFACVDVSLLARPQQSTPLGDFARQLKAERAKETKQPTKVFTNDSLPSRLPEASPTAASGMAPSSQTTAKPEVGGSGLPADVENSFRKRFSELRTRLETDQRELSVLQQKLAQNQMQYYPDPNKALNQEFSRSDVNRLTNDVQAKKDQVAADQKAIEDLQDDYRRQGGDPGFVRELMNAPITSQSGPVVEAEKPSENEKSEDKDKKKTKEYWQTKFKVARERVAKAEEQQQLVEDELNLLKIQQAREIDPNVQAEVNKKIEAKTPGLEAKRAEAAKAVKDLEALEATFKESGAPQEWGKTE